MRDLNPLLHSLDIPAPPLLSYPLSLPQLPSSSLSLSFIMNFVYNIFFVSFCTSLIQQWLPHSLTLLHQEKIEILALCSGAMVYQTKILPFTPSSLPLLYHFFLFLALLLCPAYLFHLLLYPVLIPSIQFIKSISFVIGIQQIV